MTPAPTAAELLAGRDAVVLRCSRCGVRLELVLRGPGAAAARAMLQAALLAIGVGLTWAGCESTAQATAEHVCPGCR